jgi:hypothetical protein
VYTTALVHNLHPERVDIRSIKQGMAGKRITVEALNGCRPEQNNSDPVNVWQVPYELMNCSDNSSSKTMSQVYPVDYHIAKM